MTLMRVGMFFVIPTLVTIVRFRFPRSSRVKFLRVLLFVVKLVDLMGAIVQGFAIRGEVRGTRNL